MALSSFGLGFTLGFGTGIVAREALPIARSIIKPIGRVAIKSSVLVFERSREYFAHFGEFVEDVVAEVRSDLRKSKQKSAKKMGVAPNVTNLEKARAHAA